MSRPLQLNIFHGDLPHLDLSIVFSVSSASVHEILKRNHLQVKTASTDQSYLLIDRQKVFLVGENFHFLC